MDTKMNTLMNTELGSYFLGWVLRNGKYQKEQDTLELNMRRSEIGLVKLFNEYFNFNSSLQSNDGENYKVYFKGDVVSNFEPLFTLEDKHYVFNNDKLNWSFMRGVFDSCGRILSPKISPVCRCQFVMGDNKLVDYVKEFCNFPSVYIEKDNILRFVGTNAFDLLTNIYKNGDVYHYGRKKVYNMWCNYVHGLNNTDYMVCHWSKKDKDAVAPLKANPSDSGWDLTLVKKIKHMRGDKLLWKNGEGTDTSEEPQVGDVVFYDTGVQVCPCHGWYGQVVPRSSLSKSGYMLANSVGIIDRSYTGSIIVALVKTSPNAKTLSLPTKCVQLLFTPVVHHQLVQVESMDETRRGEGGYGSTDRTE